MDKSHDNSHDNLEQDLAGLLDTELQAELEAGTANLLADHNFDLLLDLVNEKGDPKIRTIELRVEPPLYARDLASKEEAAKADEWALEALWELGQRLGMEAVIDQPLDDITITYWICRFAGRQPIFITQKVLNNPQEGQMAVSATASLDQPEVYRLPHENSEAYKTAVAIDPTMKVQENKPVVPEGRSNRVIRIASSIARLFNRKY